MGGSASRRQTLSQNFEQQIGELVSFLTGSLGEFLDRNYESEKIKTLFLANNVYGKHGGPYQPGSAIGLVVSSVEWWRAREQQDFMAMLWAEWAQ